MRVSPALALVAASLLPAPAAADGEGAAAPPPACTAAIEGAVACMAGRLCRCRFQPAGTLTARPSGFRWDCGTLRPGCGAPAAGYPVPPVLPPILLPPIPPPAWDADRWRLR
jgi:hypothetical protein